MAFYLIFSLSLFISLYLLLLSSLFIAYYLYPSYYLHFSYYIYLSCYLYSSHYFYLDNGLISRVSKFADDTKLGINAADPEAVRNLQRDLAAIGEWSNVWQMPFNLNKCHVLHAGTANQEENYSLLGSVLSSVDKERDLGVVITTDLKSSAQCIAAEQKAQKILGFIKRVFRYRNKRTVLALYKALVRPLLEYGAQF